MEAHWITPGRAYYAQLVNETAQNALNTLEGMDGAAKRICEENSAV